MSAFGTPVTPYPVIYPEVDTSGATDSTPALVAAQAALQTLAQWGTIQLPPTPFPDSGIQLNDFGLLPWFNLRGAGKKMTRVFAGALCTFSVILVHARLADYTDNTGSATLATEISDMAIDANNMTDPRTLAQGGTGNGISGIWVANAVTDDPNYNVSEDNSKAYSSIRALRLAIYGGGKASTNTTDFPDANPGAGILSDANRHRFYAEDTFVTNNQWHGLSIGGADPIVGVRCGCGSNGGSGIGFGIRANSGTNLIMVGVNCWGQGGGKRNDNCMAFLAANTSGCLLVGCVFNETIQLLGNSNADRSVNVTGCQFRPKDGLFSANGVPLGTGSNATNCFIYVDNLDCVTIAGCDFNTTRKNAFTYNFLVNARNGAHVGLYVTYNTSANERPWASADTVPYSIDLDGSSNPMSWVVGIMVDMNDATPSIRIGGRGYETVVFNVGANTAVDPTYSGMVGDPNNRPWKISTPFDFFTRIAFNKITQTISANATVINISNGCNIVLLKGTGTFTGCNIVFPQAKDNGHLIRIFVASGLTLTVIVFTVNTGGAANPSVGMPSTLGPNTGMWVVYDTNADAWYQS